MGIDAIEDSTEVSQPDGRVGLIKLSRRERKLITNGVDIPVKVRGTDGLYRTFLFSKLEEIPYKEPEEEEEEEEEEEDTSTLMVCPLCGEEYIMYYVDDKICERCHEPLVDI